MLQKNPKLQSSPSLTHVSEYIHLQHYTSDIGDSFCKMPNKSLFITEKFTILPQTPFFSYMKPPPNCIKPCVSCNDRIDNILAQASTLIKSCNLCFFFFFHRKNNQHLMVNQNSETPRKSDSSIQKKPLQ